MRLETCHWSPSPPSKTRYVEKFWCCLPARPLEARRSARSSCQTWPEAHHSVLQNEAPWYYAASRPFAGLSQESEVASAPTSLRCFMRAKAQSLYEMKCFVSAPSLWGVATAMDSDARHRMDASVSFGCEAHRVNELVVGLRIVQL
jgi:hypothetical protein